MKKKQREKKIPKDDDHTDNIAKSSAGKNNNTIDTIKSEKIFKRRELNYEIYKFNRTLELKVGCTSNKETLDAFISFAEGDKYDISGLDLFTFTQNWTPFIELNEIYLKLIEQSDNDCKKWYTKKCYYEFNALQFNISSKKN